MTPASFSPIPPAALAAFQQARAQIIQHVVTQMLAQQDKVDHLGPDTERMLAAGMEWTTRMLETAMTLGSIGLLNQQLEWAASRLPHDGVTHEHTLASLHRYHDAVAALLPAEHATPVNQYVGWMIERQQMLLAD